MYVCSYINNNNINVSSDLFVGIDPPNNVKVTLLTPNIIEVTWDPVVSEEVSGYYITYNTSATCLCQWK